MFLKCQPREGGCARVAVYTRSPFRALSFAVNLVKAKVAQSCPTLCDAMKFCRPEYWNGQPFPSPEDLPDPGIELGSPALQADSLPTELSGKSSMGLQRVKHD